MTPSEDQTLLTVVIEKWTITNGSLPSLAQGQEKEITGDDQTSKIVCKTKFINFSFCLVLFVNDENRNFRDFIEGKARNLNTDFQGRLALLGSEILTCYKILFFDFPQFVFFFFAKA